jgi:hypothetical protein
MTKERRIMPDTKGAKGGEFFVVHPDGSVSDAELHEPILSGIDRDAEACVRNIGKQQARKAGLTEAEIETLYGIE